MFVNKHSKISGMHISENKCCYNLIPSIHYFYVNRKILADFQVCLSAPLISDFLSSLFPTWTKKLEQKIKYLKNDKNFLDEIKTLFIIFKGLSLKPLKPTLLKGESPTLILNIVIQSQSSIKLKSQQGRYNKESRKN